MPAERYFTNGPMHIGQKIHLQVQEFHHLAHVMRSRLGDEIELVNGQGELAIATVVTLEKKQSSLLIQQVFQEKKSPHEIILVQAIPRSNRLDFVIEKGVELGITQLWLLPAKHSERKQLTEQQLERMQAQMIAAMKQCGRLYLPSLKLIKPLSELKSLPFSAFFGDVDPEAIPFSEAWKQLSKKNDGVNGVLFFTGPESGFTHEEVQDLKRLGVEGVKLHPNILRTDTASLTALSLISHWSYYPGSPS